MTKKKICCFTGHRKIENEYMARMPEALDALLDKLISVGVSHFRAGGAVGFDTLCALKVIEKKRKNPELTLELCLPCRDQTKTWSEREVYIYDYILAEADSVSYAEESYTQECMFKRNRMLVDGADVCLAFCSSDHGGTAYTVSYAEKNGVRVINLYDKFEKN